MQYQSYKEITAFIHCLYIVFKVQRQLDVDILITGHTHMVS